MAVNRIVVSGNLTKDSELRQTNTGISVLLNSIAVNNRAKKNGQYTDEVMYVDITLFGARADSLSQYLKKGTKVIVDGKLAIDNWKDKNGNPRRQVKIIVDNLDFAGNKKQQQSQPQQQQVPVQQVQVRASPTYAQQDVPVADMGDEIPF